MNPGTCFLSASFGGTHNEFTLTQILYYLHCKWRLFPNPLVCSYCLESNIQDCFSCLWSASFYHKAFGVFERNVPACQHCNCVWDFQRFNVTAVLPFPGSVLKLLHPPHPFTHSVSSLRLLSLAPPAGYLQAVQASSVLACIFSIIGIFVFLAQLFTLPKGQRFLVSGVFQFLACEYFFFLLCFIPFTEGVSLSVWHPLMCIFTRLHVSFTSGLCIMIAASIYTDRFHTNEQNLGSYGHCFILAWIAFALTFLSSIIYFVLRKKTAE